MRPPRRPQAASQRVRVVSPQTRLALARRARGFGRVVLAADFDAVAARRIHRRQRRLALLSMGALALLVLGLPLLLAALPALGRVRLADVPVSWLLLGAAPYPLLLLLARTHLRAAERAEGEEEPR